jgi:spore coat protein U-like protein
MSLTKVSYSMINGAPILVDEFYQPGDTDDTASFNRAILFAAEQINAGGVDRSGAIIKASAGKKYTIGGTIILVQYIDLDLQNALLEGTLSTTMFETGYYSNGTIFSNIGTPNESNTLYRCRVYNGTINYSKLAFNLFNFINQCELVQIRFNFCEKCVYGKRVFYASFINLTCNNEGGNPYNGIPGFEFQDNINACVFNGISVAHRHTGMTIKGPVFQSLLINSEFERGVNGIIIENETFAFEITNNYFETMTGIAIDLTFSAQKKHTVIDDNLFFMSPGATAIIGQLLIQGSIGPGNVYSTGGTKVEITDDLFSDIIVYANAVGGPDNATGLLDAEFILGKKVQVVGYSNIFNSVTGDPAISSLAPAGLLNFNHVGDSGTIITNNVAFCTNYSTPTGGSNFTIGIDTNIAAQSRTSMLVFYFEVIDNVATYQIFGNVYGDQVVQQDSSGKTVALTGPGGKWTFTLSTFSHPTGIYTLTGMVRHV